MCDNYQDYVIKDGIFIGKFEEMYQKFDDPWHQRTSEVDKTDKIIGISLLKRFKCNTAIELGCGTGTFTNMIAKAGIDITGIDISPTAIKKAKDYYPHIKFRINDILDFHIYEELHPQCIIMSEISWYILPKLKQFLEYYKKLKKVYLLHLLTFYAPRRQKYGLDYFSNLGECLQYFDLCYEEYGEIYEKTSDGNYRTYFLGYPKVNN